MEKKKSKPTCKTPLTIYFPYSPKNDNKPKWFSILIVTKTQTTIKYIKLEANAYFLLTIKPLYILLLSNDIYHKKDKCQCHSRIHCERKFAHKHRLFTDIFFFVFLF